MMCRGTLDYVLGLVRHFLSFPLPLSHSSFPSLLPPTPSYFHPLSPLSTFKIEHSSDADTSKGWENASDFNTFVAGEPFAGFVTRVLPHSVAAPVPQLYHTDLAPGQVFGNALTEVWQVKIGDDDKKEEETRRAWEKFVNAIAKADDVNGDGNKIQGTSVNLDEKRWSGVLGWESSEVSLKYF